MPVEIRFPALPAADSETGFFQRRITIEASSIGWGFYDREVQTDALGETDMRHGTEWLREYPIEDAGFDTEAEAIRAWIGVLRRLQEVW